MPVRTLSSSNCDMSGVIDDFKKEAQGFDARMVIFFASSKFDQHELAARMQEAFSPAAVIGCSSSGEIISGSVLKESVVAMILGSDIIDDVAIEVVANIKTENRVPYAFRSFENYYKTPMSSMDHTRYVGIILVDGLMGAEERLMGKIGDLTNVFFVGGSAGDDLGFKATYVYAGGRVYSNAAVLALIKPAKGFDIIKTQSFRKLDRTLTATKVRIEERKVIEFNHKPAVQAYAECLGISPEDAPDRFMTNPVGLMVDDEPFVRSPQKVDGKSIVFFCNIIDGMEVSLLESTDIVRDTREAIEAKEKELGGISGIINFHCILRTLELEKNDQTRAYGEIFSDIPTIGFSTYGEEYLGHINQTSTMLVFAR
jgi:hypothetical protein